MKIIKSKDIRPCSVVLADIGKFYVSSSYRVVPGYAQEQNSKLWLENSLVNQTVRINMIGWAYIKYESKCTISMDFGSFLPIEIEKIYCMNHLVCWLKSFLDFYVS